MPHNFDDVGDFHEKFDLYNTTHHPTGPRILPEELMGFRIKFLREEFDEFIEGYEERNEAKMADALVDLVYVAMGTAHLKGYPWRALWAEVQRANMTKERALSSDDSRSKRGSSYDVVKPDGWQPPDIEGVLRRHGW